MSSKSRWTNPYYLAALVAVLASVVAIGYGYTMWSALVGLLGLGLLKRAQGYNRPSPASLKDSASYVPPLKRPGRRLWIAVGVSSALVVLSSLVLRSDFLHGGQQAWPVYAFAGFALVSAFAWIRLFTRMLGFP